MFVNPKAPGSAYGMTYNCIACGDNAITFNDGYHIQHHLNSRTHWSELPLRFMESLEEHVAQAGDHLASYSVPVNMCKYCVSYLGSYPMDITSQHGSERAMCYNMPYAAPRLHCVHAGLAFKGLSVFEVGLAVFMGRMDLLVDHLLICGGELGQMSKFELKEMLRERLKPILRTN